MALLVLTADDVLAIVSNLTPNFLVTTMALVFAQSYTRDVLLPHRSSIVTSSYNALFMPARVNGFGTTMKVVSVPRGASASEGIPATTLVLDEDTGEAKAIVNAGRLTALRTAAGSVLASRLLGPPLPHTLLVFGSGNQAEAHIDFHVQIFPSIVRCTIVNRSPNQRLTGLCTSLQTRHPHVEFDAGCAINGVGVDNFDLQRAILLSDVICTATPSTRPLFKARWVKSGTHINLIGSYTPDMHEVEDSLIRRAGKILVDSREACQYEAGEIISTGVASEDMVEIGQLVEIDGKSISSEVMRVKAAGDVTIFKSVGVGLQDTAIACAVVEKAIDLSIGTRVEGYNRA